MNTLNLKLFFYLLNSLFLSLHSNAQLLHLKECDLNFNEELQPYLENETDNTFNKGIKISSTSEVYTKNKELKGGKDIELFMSKVLNNAKVKPSLKNPLWSPKQKLDRLMLGVTINRNVYLLEVYKTENDGYVGAIKRFRAILFISGKPHYIRDSFTRKESQSYLFKDIKLIDIYKKYMIVDKQINELPIIK